jgi:hypothetical protein
LQRLSCLFGICVGKGTTASAQKGVDAENARNAQEMLAEGKKTFGSEAFWG